MQIRKKLHHFLYRAFTAGYGLIHPIQNKVLFSSFGGKQYSDSPRAISEALHKMFPETKIVWHLRSKEDTYGIIPEYVTFVSEGNLSFYRELATSFCFVTNEDIKSYVRKRKGQYFIQTWHGDRPFKKVLYDIDLPIGTNLHVEDEKVTDLCVAASDIGVDVYRSAFRYKGKIIRTGMPRNDCLLQNDENLKRIIRRKIGIDKEKVLIYAPTFRDGLRQKQDAVFDINVVLQILEKRGESWVCLVRAHSSSQGIQVNAKNDKIINVSDYPDMSDLLMISDMLITDYSSCAGDFILTGKPVILAQFDKEEYNKNCRQFKVNPRDAHFIIADNQEELLDIIENTTVAQYAQNCKDICSYFNITESGHSSEDICRLIYNFNKNRNNGRLI